MDLTGKWSQLFCLVGPHVIMRTRAWFLSLVPAKKKKKPSKVNSFPGGTVVKNPPANAGDTGDLGLIFGLGRSPGEGNGNPLQYSCLGNPMDRGAWQATVHGITELDTTELTCMHTYTCITESLCFISEINTTL